MSLPNPIRDQLMIEPFTIGEATQLIHSTCIRKDAQRPLSISDIGVICGLMDLNQEVEILIKFPAEMRQLMKHEFIRDYRTIEE